MAGRQGETTRENEEKRQRGDTESAEERREFKKVFAQAEENRADDAGSGAAESASGTANPRVPGESGAGAAGDPGLGGDFTAAGLLFTGEIGACGDDSRFGIGRAGGRAGAQHV